MVTTPSPASRSGTASPASNAEGYLLLTIQHAVVKQVSEDHIPKSPILNLRSSMARSRHLLRESFGESLGFLSGENAKTTA